jgi:hypothetical protein
LIKKETFRSGRYWLLTPAAGVVLFLVIVVLNNVLYHHKPWMWVLPEVQKITFLMFLGWVFWISVKLYSRAGNNPGNER